MTRASVDCCMLYCGRFTVPFLSEGEFILYYHSSFSIKENDARSNNYFYCTRIEIMCMKLQP